MSYILAIDQGTTSTRAFIYNERAQVVSKSQKTLTQYFPQSAWVEQNPKEIIESCLQTAKEAIALAKIDAKAICALGITNQRETTILWDKNTGEAVYPAIVWQDRRTHAFCQNLIEQGLEEEIKERSGLLCDPYFCASKIAWVLNTVPGIKKRAQAGDILFGTVETYLIWILSAGKSHVTDYTNASRTLLLNIKTLQWDETLLEFFQIPKAILPRIEKNTAFFGECHSSFFAAPIPILAAAGDQQAGALGQACLQAGMSKATFGTGCFVLANTGNNLRYSSHRLLSTIHHYVGEDLAYGMEGSIFVAGAAVSWLKDAMRCIDEPADTEKIALDMHDNGGVYLVPAFTGLGAPYWDPLARGAILGLTRDTGVAHIVRAALEAVCYQTQDLILAMREDGVSLSNLRVDGGMSVNDWLMQFLADMLNLEVDRASQTESTVWGIAFLAGLQAGVFSDLNELSQLRHTQKIFKPQMPENLRDKYYEGWLNAVKRVR